MKAIIPAAGFGTRFLPLTKAQPKEMLPVVNKPTIQWVIEDNGVSVHTQTESAWGKHSDIPEDVIYYKYEMIYPHHGTGKWVNF